MKFLLKGLFSSLLILTGCSDSGTTIPIEGKWVSENCEIKSITTGPGTISYTWGKGVFDFTPAGELLIGFKSYSDSDCVTQTKESVGTISNTKISYIHLGSAAIQEGIDAYGLTLTPYRHSDSDTEFRGFYTLSNEKLCFSESFAFDNSGGYSFSDEPNNLSIDFDNCLINP